nr:MAG TPA: hypothetical protein [Caudoviricetes sp.]
MMGRLFCCRIQGPESPVSVSRCLPPATCHLPPATCHLPPATCRSSGLGLRLRSATCHRMPATCLLPAACCLLPDPKIKKKIKRYYTPTGW